MRFFGCGKKPAQSNYIRDGDPAAVEGEQVLDRCCGTGSGTAQMKLQTVRTPDGKIWWSAFTSFEEEVGKIADQVKSTFLSEQHSPEDLPDNELRHFQEGTMHS